MPNPIAKETSPQPLRLPEPGQRRSFTEAMKRQIVEETTRPGMSVSSVARRYKLSPSVLFRWRSAMGLGVPREGATFVPVEIRDSEDATLPMPAIQPSAAPAIVLERPAPGIEIELIGGRRVRFDRDIDPETVGRLVRALEGGAS